MMDCHCHLNSGDFDSDRDEVIKRAKGIFIIDAGTDFESNAKSLEISKNYKDVYSCLGMEPCLQDFQRISRMIRENKNDIVGIGEIGLDYMKCRDRDNKDFASFIRLAKELKKPLVIHSRWAVGPCMDLLEREGAKKVMMHAFSGNEKEAERAVGNRWIISIPTSIIWSEQKQMIAEKVPLKNLVAETDSPVMWKGRNEPKNVRLVVEKVAEIKDISVDRADKIMTENGRRLFGID